MKSDTVHIADPNDIRLDLFAEATTLRLEADQVALVISKGDIAIVAAADPPDILTKSIVLVAASLAGLVANDDFVERSIKGFVDFYTQKMDEAVEMLRRAVTDD